MTPDGRWGVEQITVERGGRTLVRLRVSSFGTFVARLKVRKSSYQYQDDAHGQREVFRYDYLREPGDAAGHPTAHLNVHGTLDAADALPTGRTLARVHFPTDRVSIEAVIRLLAQDFGVPCARPPEVWRPVLSASEATFREIAHRPGA